MKLNELLVVPATSLKRKREEVVDSQSEDEADSDREFGWLGNFDTLTTETVPD